MFLLAGIILIIASLFLFSFSRPLKKKDSILCPVPKEGFVPFEFPEIPSSDEQPLVVGPAGETFHFIQTGSSSNGKYLFARLIVPPHVGPPPHIHHWTDEWFYAPKGGFSMFMGETAYPDLKKVPGENLPKDVACLMPMRPKELFYGPRYYIHGFMNTTDKPQELYLVWTPDTKDVSILPYFLNAGTVVKPGETDKQPDFLSRIRLVSMAPDYGINQSSDFWQYIKTVKEEKPAHMNDDHRKELLELLKTFSKKSTPVSK